MIGLVTITAAGRAGADRLAQAWPGQTKHYPGPAATALPQAFTECEAVVAFLATGATIRILAPLLSNDPSGGKDVDPAVICVDQAHRFAIALLGGHQGGANRLAHDVAAILEAEPVITTATDSQGIPGLDDLGLPALGDIAGVSRAMLDGETISLIFERRWPLPAFPPHIIKSDHISDHDQALDDTPKVTHTPEVTHSPEIRVTDRTCQPRPGLVVIHPPTLVLGIGASRGADPADLTELVNQALASADLAPASIREIATIDLKAHEPAILALAEQLGVPLTLFPSTVLAAQDVPNPSDTVCAAVGTPSVAEAAVLAAGANLIVNKHLCATSTVAVGRYPPRGRLAIIGIGPGAHDLITPRAVTWLRACSVVIGLSCYCDQVSSLLRPGTTVLSSGMGDERQRAQRAIHTAQAGSAVALIGSGDAGIYAMASPTWETLATTLDNGGPPIDIIGVPGITAALAAASRLGAPLGNDHAYISLSDLHTPWEIIERRLIAAASGDFTIALYNPRSRTRTEPLDMALNILRTSRDPSTPVGVVRNACRPDEQVEITTLADLNVTTVDMLTIVIVGASDTRMVNGHMITPRGYRWMT